MDYADYLKKSKKSNEAEEAEERLRRLRKKGKGIVPRSSFGPSNGGTIRGRGSAQRNAINRRLNS